MKIWMVIVLVAVSSPASAQIDSLLRRAEQAKERKQQFDEWNITEDEEKQIGAEVSAKVRQRFGVVQDAAVHKYVTLVGTALAQQTERPNLPWTFIVLDTDGVNAFAAPGGYVHITRGALGLIKTEAELAGVLGHEIMHVARKHTVNALRKSKGLQMVTKETLAARAPFLSRLTNQAYEMVLENEFDRGDELDADKEAALLVQKLGYAPAALADFLSRLDERNATQTQRNGLFASHPETKERLDQIKQIAGSRTGAVVAARYTSTIKYQPTALTQIAVVTEGTAGLTGSGNDKTKTDTEPSKAAAPKKKGFGLGSLTKLVTPEQSSQQVAASGGARGVGPDRLAKGGDNPNLVMVSVSADDVATFKKGIV